MYRTILTAGVTAVVLLLSGHESFAQRGGRGGGGIGGGARPAAAAGAYGGAGVATRPAPTPLPSGGTRTTGSSSGSYTTQRGTTIDYAGAGAKGTTAGGVNYGRGVGGVQVTTASGKEVTKVGTAGGAVGPGGNAVGGRAGVTTGSGPGGSFSTAYKGGVAVGPQGVAATGGRVGTATGAGGTVSGATHWGAAAGPYGAAAYRGGVAVGPGGAVATGGAAARGYGTYYASRATIATTGTAVRANFRAFAYQYPALTARWVGPTWRPITWAALSSYGGYPTESASYDYGESVVYSGDTVTVNNTEVPAEQYAQQATDIAATGKEAKADPKEGEWQPLGVFAMVGEGETKSTNIFQLAVNKDGVIRGEYYNAVADTTEPIYGSVDKKTQRAAWTVADRKTPVYEAGIVNLTQEETTMLAHYGKDKRQQYTLVRLKQPEGDQPMGDKK